MPVHGLKIIDGWMDGWTKGHVDCGGDQEEDGLKCGWGVCIVCDRPFLIII